MRRVIECASDDEAKVLEAMLRHIRRNVRTSGYHGAVSVFARYKGGRLDYLKLECEETEKVSS